MYLYDLCLLCVVACRWDVLVCVVGAPGDVLLLWVVGFPSDVLLCVCAFSLRMLYYYVCVGFSRLNY